jgi:hypothetical protein
LILRYISSILTTNQAIGYITPAIIKIIIGNAIFNPIIKKGNKATNINTSIILISACYELAGSFIE